MNGALKAGRFTGIDFYLDGNLTANLLRINQMKRYATKCIKYFGCLAVLRRKMTNATSSYTCPPQILLFRCWPVLQSTVHGMLHCIVSNMNGLL